MFCYYDIYELWYYIVIFFPYILCIISKLFSKYFKNIIISHIIFIFWQIFQTQCLSYITKKIFEYLKNKTHCFTSFFFWLWKFNHISFFFMEKAITSRIKNAERTFIWYSAGIFYETGKFFPSISCTWLAEIDFSKINFSLQLLVFYNLNTSLIVYEGG